jgi:predicted DNA-binding transcriptional regulator AlpA
VTIDFSILLQRAREFTGTIAKRSGEWRGLKLSMKSSFTELLTPEELAERLKVPTSWVYEKRRPRCKNPLPAVPLGKIVRFDWSAIVEWLEKQVAEDAAGINRRRSIVPVRRIRRERAK